MNIEILNKKLKDKLDCDGYSVVKILSQEVINSIDHYLSSIIDTEDINGFSNLMNFQASVSQKKEINNTINSFCMEYIQLLFKNFEPFIASFAYKSKSEFTDVPLHLDWSILDEKKHTSYNIWIPLQETNIENGCMGVLEKSHNYGYTVRGSLINNIASFNLTHNILEDMKKTYASKPIFLKPGEALIYNHKLAHFSYPNLSEKCRKAISIVISPKGIQKYHYHFEENNSVSVFELDTDFYYQYDLKTNPNNWLKKVDEISAETIKTRTNQLNPIIRMK